MRQNNLLAGILSVLRVVGAVFLVVIGCASTTGHHYRNGFFSANCGERRKFHHHCGGRGGRRGQTRA